MLTPASIAILSDERVCQYVGSSVVVFGSGGGATAFATSNGSSDTDPSDSPDVKVGSTAWLAGAAVSSLSPIEESSSDESTAEVLGMEADTSICRSAVPHLRGMVDRQARNPQLHPQIAKAAVNELKIDVMHCLHPGSLHPGSGGNAVRGLGTSAAMTTATICCRCCPNKKTAAVQEN
jgi:hypothetical protein